MPAKHTISILSLFLALSFFFSGCTAINYGVGVALSPQMKQIQKEEYKPKGPIRNNYTLKVFSNSSEKEVHWANGLFIKEQRSGELHHMRTDTVIIRSKDGSYLKGEVTHIEKSPNGNILQFNNDQKLSVHKIDSIKFYSEKKERPKSGDKPLTAADFLTPLKTLPSSEIGGFYLGFDVCLAFDGCRQDDIEPYFVEVDQVDEVVYQTGMGLLPIYLASIGLLTDIIVGTLILVL